MGIELAQMLSRLGIVSIYVTGSEVETELSPFALGILCKPVDPDDLVHAVRVALSLRAGEPPDSIPARLRLFQAYDV